MRRVAVLAGLVAVRAAAAGQARADRRRGFRLRRVAGLSLDLCGRRGAGVGARRGEAQTEEPEEAHFCL